MAASLMMQGLAANHMTTESYAIQPGDVAFVHSAAGGLGLMLTQLIKARGGRVIGRVSSPEKAEIARAAGADDVVVTKGGNFVDEVSRMTGGRYPLVEAARAHEAIQSRTTTGKLLLLP
jgi:NADPH:quinone reductase